jgi:hypothetical protein
LLKKIQFELSQRDSQLAGSTATHELDWSFVLGGPICWVLQRNGVGRPEEESLFGNAVDHCNFKLASSNLRWIFAFELTEFYR